MFAHLLLSLINLKEQDGSKK